MKLPRFYPILDTAASTIPVETAAGVLLDEGARIVQLRHKGHFSREMFEIAGNIAVKCRQTGALFIVNDRADMAALLDAGVRLGQEIHPRTGAASNRHARHRVFNAQRRAASRFQRTARGLRRVGTDFPDGLERKTESGGRHSGAAAASSAGAPAPGCHWRDHTGERRERIRGGGGFGGGNRGSLPSIQRSCGFARACARMDETYA